MFTGFHTNKGIRLGAITEFSREADGEIRCSLEGGGACFLTCFEFETAIASTVQASFPAPPGAKALSAFQDEKNRDAGFVAETLLGLYIDAAGTLRVLTVSGAEEVEFIQFADGHIENVHGERFENITELLKAKGFDK